MTSLEHLKGSPCAASSARSATRNIVPILIEGLKRLEYRGYDSCGVAVHQDGELQRARSTARVAELDGQVAEATASTAAPASPTPAGPRTARRRCTTRTRTSAATRIALVHNGIIENHDELRAELQGRGYVFTSQTDTEVIAHLVDQLYDGDLFDAVQRAALRLQGRLRHRRVLPRRAAPRGRRARRLAAGAGRGRRARTSSPPTPWRWPA